jgi:hypothetical protein
MALEKTRVVFAVVACSCAAWAAAKGNAVLAASALLVLVFDLHLLAAWFSAVLFVNLFLRVSCHSRP